MKLINIALTAINKFHIILCYYVFKSWYVDLWKLTCYKHNTTKKEKEKLHLSIFNLLNFEPINSIFMEN